MEVLLFYPALTVVIVFVLALSSGMLSAKIAELKGHSTADIWGMAGFFLGPIALIAAAGLPDLTTRKLLREYLDRLP